MRHLKQLRTLKRTSPCVGLGASIVLIAFFLLVAFFVIVVQADDPTVVFVSPASQTVSVGGTVFVTVDCAPRRPVTGFELNLAFNPVLLQVTSVIEGDFFSGYNLTFFNPGVINNQAGIITNVYDLIVGQGNVTQNGSFVTITFIAKSYSGTSAITLFDVQVTNETKYIPVITYFANITVEGESTPPDSMAPVVSQVSLVSSSPLDTQVEYGWENVTCTVTDNVAVGVVRCNLTNPDSSHSSYVMTKRGGTSTYYTNRSFSASGNYSYFIRATDSSGNAAVSTATKFSLPPNWDINNDGRCTILDLVLVSNHYDQSGGHGWLREDVDNNGMIQVLDIVLVSGHFSEVWWV